MLEKEKGRRLKKEKWEARERNTSYARKKKVGGYKRKGWMLEKEKGRRLKKEKWEARERNTSDARKKKVGG